MEKPTLDSSCCFNCHLLEASVMLWRWGGAVCLCQSQPCCLFSILSRSDAFSEALSHSQEEEVTPWLFRQSRDVLCAARWGVKPDYCTKFGQSWHCPEWQIMNPFLSLLRVIALQGDTRISRPAVTTLEFPVLLSPLGSTCCALLLGLQTAS